MLVLTRRIGETICIGDDIEVRVLEVSSGKVRLGIEAPDDQVIVREELKRRKDFRPGNANRR